MCHQWAQETNKSTKGLGGGGGGWGEEKPMVKIEEIWIEWGSVRLLELREDKQL